MRLHGSLNGPPAAVKVRDYRPSEKTMERISSLKTDLSTPFISVEFANVDRPTQLRSCE
jgi:hypothetical protein